MSIPTSFCFYCGRINPNPRYSTCDECRARARLWYDIRLPTCTHIPGNTRLPNIPSNFNPYLNSLDGNVPSSSECSRTSVSLFANQPLHPTVEDIRAPSANQTLHPGTKDTRVLTPSLANQTLLPGTEDTRNPTSSLANQTSRSLAL